MLNCQRLTARFAGIPNNLDTISRKYRRGMPSLSSGARKLRDMVLHSAYSGSEMLNDVQETHGGPQ